MEMSKGIISAIACAIALFAWLVFFVLGNFIFELIFVTVTTAVLVIWGILITIVIGTGLSIYLDDIYKL